MSAYGGDSNMQIENANVGFVPQADMTDDRNGSGWPSDTSGSRWMMRSPLPMQIEVGKLGQSKRTLPLN